MDDTERAALVARFLKAQDSVYPEALMVPQQAVARDSGGGTTVLVVDPEGKLEARPVRVGGVDRDRYIVEEGLKAGDRVVVDGQQKVMPGAVVRAVPWTAGKTATARD